MACSLDVSILYYFYNMFYVNLTDKSLVWGNLLPLKAINEPGITRRMDSAYTIVSLTNKQECLHLLKRVE